MDGGNKILIGLHFINKPTGNELFELTKKNWNHIQLKGNNFPYGISNLKVTQYNTLWPCTCDASKC